MLLFLLILIPLLFGIGCFFIKNDAQVKTLSLLSAIITLGICFYACSLPANSPLLSFSHAWMGGLNTSFTLKWDGVGKITALLTAIAFPVIFTSVYTNNYKSSNQFYGLMLLSQAGLMGVFLTTDCLTFYFFWELALIPAYFLCSIWGGEKRIAVSFKFFIYTFIGSLIMLVAIIYLYNKTPDKSFAFESFKQAVLNAKEQSIFFWMFFIAFAIKMPIFPFHTWQPDAYEQAPTATTMVLSGIMVKMGLFAVIRWLLPIFPAASIHYSKIVIILCIIGMLYASLIAIRQNNIKRLVAYSSIAHIGLMCAALFVNNKNGFEGAIIQMFMHGVNIIGLWIVIDIIEQKTGIVNISELGGIAHKAPVLTIILVIIALANIALPLTNAFVGEFLMFNGLYQKNVWYAVIAGISIILAAVYTLGMIQKVFLGEKNNNLQITDINFNQAFALGIIVVAILMMGTYPKPILELAKNVF
jgi:NADH-quinone oxidoreductase subunit M